MRDEAGILPRLAPFLRVRPELRQICRFGAQWASPHGPEDDGWAPFHVVTHGACMLDAGERVGIHLQAGDVALLPHGGPHTVRALPDAGGRAGTLRVQARRHDSLVVKSNVDGEVDTRLVCGRLRFEQVDGNMVLAALPALVVLHASGGRDAGEALRLVELIAVELEEDRLGAAAVAEALATSLVIVVLRAHFGSGQEAGLLALLTRRQTARALAAMLREPGRDWTLDGLAQQASTSRATLVRLFRSTVDRAPLAFLAELRLTLARSRLRASASPLAVIAEGVGYQSETAFSRAYARKFGVAPGADRARPR